MRPISHISSSFFVKNILEQRIDAWGTDIAKDSHPAQFSGSISMRHGYKQDGCIDKSPFWVDIYRYEIGAASLSSTILSKAYQLSALGSIKK